MIRNIKVSGFKSLENFQLDINPGINVLVGPNGSGKSNILSFFEFLSNISNYSLPEAISRSGGAGAIFRRLPDKNIKTVLEFEVYGYGKSEKEHRYRSYISRSNPNIYRV